MNILQTFADRNEIRFIDDLPDAAYIKAYNDRLLESEKAVAEGRILAHSDVKKSVSEWISAKK